MATNPPLFPENASQNNHAVPALTASEREALDARMLAGEDVPGTSLIAALSSEPPPEGDLLRTYAERLMRHALDARDAEAAVLLTRVMDEHADLDAALDAELNERLQTEPDAVYALVRARMYEDASPRWLERLRVAALAALQVAITDGDAETAINWLRLVAREPASFELSDLVHYGLLAAAERARNEPVLGRLLIPLALRRDPDVMEQLLADDTLQQKLAEETNLGRVLRGEGDVLQTLQNHGYDMAVVAAVRAADAKQGALFTPAAVEQLWSVVTGAQPVNVPPQYAPEGILQAWLADGVTWLEEPAIERILALSLRDRRDESFLALAHQLAKRETFTRLVASAFARSGRPESDILALTAPMQAAGDLTPQGALDVKVRLLNTWEWNKNTLPVVQQVARLLNQHPTLTVHPDVLWHILDIADENKDESLVRIGAKRVTADIEVMEDEAAAAERLLRLTNETNWHAPTRQSVMTWWRSFARSSTLGKLQRFDKAFEGKKPLDDARTILQTIIAFRKMLGKRTLQQFAWDVGVAYGILQAMNDSFEPSPKRGVAFDQATMRAELDARSDELTPHEQKIMANNLKELAALIGAMGDTRAKATLMRRSDDVDRLLMMGEQTPHSAVDALKWLSGYLSGSQEKDEEGEE